MSMDGRLTCLRAHSGLTLTREMQPLSLHYDTFMTYCSGTLNETGKNYCLTYKGQAEVVHIQW